MFSTPGTERGREGGGPAPVVVADMEVGKGGSASDVSHDAAGGASKACLCRHASRVAARHAAALRMTRV